MSELSIRPVTRDDVPAVLALWRVVFPEYTEPSRPHRDPSASIARKLDFGDGLFWLAERGSRVVGTAMAGWDGHRGWLYSVGVHPAERRTGIGARLVAQAERALAALGCPKVNVQVLAGNAGGVEFWRGVGFAEDAVRPLGKPLQR